MEVSTIFMFFYFSVGNKKNHWFLFHSQIQLILGKSSSISRKPFFSLLPCLILWRMFRSVRQPSALLQALVLLQSTVAPVSAALLLCAVTQQVRETSRCNKTQPESLIHHLHHVASVSSTRTCRSFTTGGWIHSGTSVDKIAAENDFRVLKSKKNQTVWVLGLTAGAGAAADERGVLVTQLNRRKNASCDMKRTCGNNEQRKVPRSPTALR